MKKNLTKYAAASLLAAAMLAAVSCGSDAGEQEKETGAEAGTAAATTAAETEADLYANVPTADYGGEPFRIFSSTCSWALYQLNAESTNGEVLNDAVFNRNAAVESRLNVKLEIEETHDYWDSQEEVRKSVMAGEDAWDATYLSTYRAAPLAVDNLYTNLYDIKSLHLEEPWWNHQSIPYYELKDALYWAHGDASVHYYDCIWTMFFNRQMLNDLDLDDPFELVQSGKWTIDRVNDMAKTAAADLNADGKMDENDRFGITTHSGTCFGFMHGLDQRAITIENGIPKVSPLTDTMYNALEKIQNIMSNKDAVRVNGDDFCKTLFTSGQALFLNETLGNAANLRNMDADFGIVPFPKYDESQESYHSYMSPSAISVQIPVTVQDPERSGTVIECMNALSYETVRPAYYEIVLGQKYVRDETSRKMLDDMFTGAECELAYVYQWGNYQQIMVDCLYMNKPLASNLEAAIPATEAAISDFIGSLN